MSSPSTVNPFTFPTARTDGRVCGLVTVSSCTRPSVMEAADSHCPDPVRVWRTSEPLRSSSATEARVTAITMRRKPLSGWRRSRITNSSSGRNSKRSRLATYSPEYRDAKCACVVLKRDHVELYVNFILVDFPLPSSSSQTLTSPNSHSFSRYLLYMLPFFYVHVSLFFFSVYLLGPGRSYRLGRLFFETQSTTYRSPAGYLPHVCPLPVIVRPVFASVVDQTSLTNIRI